MTISPPPTRRSTYDKRPAIPLGDEHRLWRGTAAWHELIDTATQRSPRPRVAVDAYPGVNLAAMIDALQRSAPGWSVIDIEELAAKRIDVIDRMLADDLTEDRVFGVLTHRTIDTFYDPDALEEGRRTIDGIDGPVAVVGWGAALAVPDPTLLVLADLARWEIQQRQRSGAPNWRAANGDEDPLRKYKRGFFVEWRVADRHKRTLFDRVDYLLDTNDSIEDAKLITGDAFRSGLAAAVRGPFRVVPFFDPGVWGGQWMKEVCGLDDRSENYAWCFDCVPEENSLLLRADGVDLEVPSLDVVLTHPRELLGELTFARFGAEFPIRFDFLDTMGGGNLSLQVHPLTAYIQERFGMTYTQDESYYLLDAADDAVVYLGLRDDADPDLMAAELARAQDGGASFPADRFVNTFPARKHDHFLIPAGTVHCSGADSMVLEISATPYIFTFKMWDWDRVGLDGRPRPIHLEHALANVQWDRRTDWVTDELVDRVEQLDAGDGWIEERTGLHELEFIEVRRHWFTGTVPHDTEGTVNVLNLVEGAEAVVESPIGAFPPFIVHYAETFIVPAAVGPYTVRPHGAGRGQRLGTVKARVRGTERGRTALAG